MRGTWTQRTLLVAMCAALAVATAGFAADATTISPTPEKGMKAAFTVQSTSSTEGTSPNGEFKMINNSQIHYKVVVDEVKDNGDVILKITFGSVKTKQGGRDETWEFDSSKPAGDDAVAAFLQKVVKSTATVTLSEGEITDVQGLPEVVRPEGRDQATWRRMRRMRAVGEFSIRRHLDMIISKPVIGVTLEEGKEYRRVREADGEGRRRRGFFGGASNMVYTYKGTRGNNVRFALSADQPQGGQEGRPRGEMKLQGQANFSLKDGLLRRLQAKTVGSRSMERDGQTYKWTSTSNTVIKRGAPGQPGARKKKARPRKNRAKKAKQPAATDKNLQSVQSGLPAGTGLPAFPVHDITGKFNKAKGVCYI